MFGLFKKKPKEPEYLFNQQVEYKGHFIRVWAKRDTNAYRNFPDPDKACLLMFDVGWDVGEHGYYHSGISAERLEEVIKDHLESGKKTIDKILAQPAQIESAMKAVKETLSNINL